MNKRKVAFLTSGYPPESGIFYHRSIKIISKDFEVKIFRIRSFFPILKNPIFNYEYEGIKVKQIFLPFLPFKNFNYLRFLGYISIFFVKEIKNFDLIHCGSLYPLGIICSIWAKKFKLPLIAQAVGINETNEVLKHLSKEKLKKFFKNFDYIITNSEDLKKRILSFVDYQNIEVIYRGVDFNVFNEDGEKDERFLKYDGFKFLYIGGFQTKNPKKFDKLNVKGGHILLQAWEKAEEQLNNCYLGIGGPGSDFDYLEEWRKSLRNPEKVIIISKGRIESANVPNIIRSFDCVVVPSLSEGLPNLANEAQSCGRPVLGTKVGGIPESVVHNETGILIEPNSVEELSKALLWFSKNCDLAKEMGKKGAERMKKYRSWDNYRGKMKEVYENVWKKKKL